MRRGIRIVCIGLVLAAASACTAAAATWAADFTPSMWNLAVGDVVDFSVCETCLGSGAGYRYIWDFDSDGVVDVDTEATVVACTFNLPGFYEVKLTIRDSGGREQTRTKGLVVGDTPAVAVREVVAQDDGSYLVSVGLTIVSPVAAPGLVESIPSGWQAEIVDAAGAMTRLNPETRELEVGWLSQAAPGDQIVFSYRLYSNYASQVRTLSGEMSGYVGGTRFAHPVCGELRIP